MRDKINRQAGVQDDIQYICLAVSTFSCLISKIYSKKRNYDTMTNSDVCHSKEQTSK